MSRKHQRKHGLTGMPEFDIYRAMVDRCARHPSYRKRGIRVWQEWLDDPRKFVEYVGNRPSHMHSLDRIDNDGHYEPGNVRWATWREQSRNKANNAWLEVGGRRMVLADWAAETGLDPTLIAHRISRGWPPEKVISKIRYAAGRPKKMLTFDGKTMCLKEWAGHLGLNPATLTLRMKRTNNVAEILRPVAQEGT
jgi:hypothetical protein